MNKRVTIRDLALELGMSNSAVSLALNPRDSTVKLKPETIRRVQELAVKRNYRPDSRARSMRYGRFFNIGYFEAKKNTDAWPILGAGPGVFDAACEKDYRVVLIRLPVDAEHTKGDIPKLFKESHLDALIVSHAGNLSPELQQVIDRSGFPVVYLNEKKKKNAVYVDEVSSAEVMTQHLIDLGHRKVVYVFPDTSHPFHYSYEDRWLGYKKAMEKSGLCPERLICGLSQDYQPREFLRWLHNNTDVDAILAYSDFIAMGVFRVLYQTSLRVPAGVSVAGFGDDFAPIAPVFLTTMKNPFYEMGMSAVEMALRLLDQNRKAVPSIVCSSRLISRDSTRMV